MLRAPRGTHDVMPDEQGYWRLLVDKAREVCRLYGYQRLDTPVLEDATLFVRGIGAGTDIVEKEMYSFQDRGGDMITLRPEGTAPICRAYLEHGMHSLPQPVRLYYLGPIFRYERPQAGRYRQHFQFGYEAIGEQDPALDLEVISMAWHFTRALGLTDTTIHLNSIGCPQCRPNYWEALRAHYGPHSSSLCPDCRRRLERNPLRLLDCKKPGCVAVGEAAPRSLDFLCPECAQHFARLRRYLELSKVPCTLDHHLVRGLDYYTKTVFEVQPRLEGAQSALGGGGRYDGLIEELGGKPTPGVGYATGFERLAQNLQRAGAQIPGPSKPRVFLVPLGERAREEGLRLAAELRAAGVPVTAGVGERSLKAQLRQADALGAAHALILGDAELEASTVLVRDMSTSEQKAIPRDQVAATLGASGPQARRG